VGERDGDLTQSTRHRGGWTEREAGGSCAAARLGAEALDVGREYVSLRLDHWHEALDGCHGVGISARRLSLTLKSYLELGLERDELRYGTEQCLSPQIYRHVGSSFPVCLTRGA